MKKTVFILCVMLLIAPTIGLNAQQMKVAVKTPGTLAEILRANKNNITDLTVSGALNGSDLRFLREMAGRDINSNETEGTLKKLNLRNASFVTGGDYYYIKGKQKLYSSNSHLFPHFLFSRCGLEEIIFPANTDTIGQDAFAYSGLRHLKLPGNALVDYEAFKGDSLLETVSFPKLTKGLIRGCFNGCNKLKKLEINDIGYISGSGLQQMKSLETINVKGYLLHADGSETVDNCPNLKSIDFYGPVYSTGGSIFASNCAKLEHITFHGPVLSTYFGKTENCPSFKGYVVKNIVINSGYKDLIPETPKEQLEKNPEYKKMCEQMIKITKAASSDNNDLIKKIFSTNLYNIACHYSIANNKDEAFKYLDAAIDAGFNSYYNMKAEKDFTNIRGDKRYDEMLERVRLVGDKLLILKNAAPYEQTGKTEPRFTYAEPTDSGLVVIREFFNLDSIAGKGDEISRIKNLLYWFHDAIRHDGSSAWPNCNYNAKTLYQVAKSENRGYNCRFMAEMLNEIYLAEGFKSRFLTCLPRDYDTDNDCHVINVVWSKTLHKWVWMDPTFCAFVTDENGLLLHPGEVRERLIKGLPLILNKDANWNHKENETKENYLDYYMAKNLYMINAHLRSEYETESYQKGPKSPDVTLLPKGFKYPNTNEITSDDAYFWQAPEGE